MDDLVLDAHECVDMQSEMVRNGLAQHGAEPPCSILPGLKLCDVLGTQDATVRRIAIIGLKKQAEERDLRKGYPMVLLEAFYLCRTKLADEFQVQN